MAGSLQRRNSDSTGSTLDSNRYSWPLRRTDSDPAGTISNTKSRKLLKDSTDDSSSKHPRNPATSLCADCQNLFHHADKLQSADVRLPLFRTPIASATAHCTVCSIMGQRFSRRRNYNLELIVKDNIFLLSAPAIGNRSCNLLLQIPPYEKSIPRAWRVMIFGLSVTGSATLRIKSLHKRNGKAS